MFVPGGQVFGAGLISFGADVVIQKATTGEVNWAQAGISGGLGMLGFGAGAAVGRAFNNPLVHEAVTNGVEGAVSGAGGYFTGPGPHTPTGFFKAAAAGAGVSALPIPDLIRVAGQKIGATVLQGINRFRLRGQYGPANPGPLPLQAAETFRSASYHRVKASEPVDLYRVYGGDAGPLSPFWSRDVPAGPLQAQLDSALNPAWGNTATEVSHIRVPAGTRFYEGFAAPQPLGGASENPWDEAYGSLLGGGNQVYIDRMVPDEWVVK